MSLVELLVKFDVKFIPPLAFNTPVVIVMLEILVAVPLFPAKKITPLTVAVPA